MIDNIIFISDFTLVTNVQRSKCKDEESLSLVMDFQSTRLFDSTQGSNGVGYFIQH